MIALTIDDGSTKVRIMCKEVHEKALKGLGFSKPRNQSEVKANDCRHASMFVQVEGELIQFVGPVDYMAFLAEKTGCCASPEQAAMAAAASSGLRRRGRGRSED